MTHSHAKGQGQSGQKLRAETDGRTERRMDKGDCITFRANVVGHNQLEV